MLSSAKYHIQCQFHHHLHRTLTQHNANKMPSKASPCPQPGNTQRFLSKGRSDLTSTFLRKQPTAGVLLMHDLRVPLLGASLSVQLAISVHSLQTKPGA